RTAVLAAVTNAMAVLEADLIESDARLMTSAVLEIARQRCLLVLLTDLHPVAVSEGLMPRLPALAARHQLLLAAVADPRLAGLAGGRGDAAAVYTAGPAGRGRGARG